MLCYKLAQLTILFVTSLNYHHDEKIHLLADAFLISPDASSSSLPIRSPVHYRKTKGRIINRAVLEREPNSSSSSSELGVVERKNGIVSLQERNQSSTSSSVTQKAEAFEQEEEQSLSNRKSSKSLALITGLGVLTGVSVAAKFNVFGWDYTDSLILRDVGCFFLTGALGATFVKACTYLASQNILQPRDSRKIIHTLSAPLFILFWPVFSSLDGARYFAAIVPLMNGIRLYIAGSSGIGGDESELANAVSRSGDTKEALGGPFIYVVILFGCLVAFWRDSPVGIMALSAMAAGDGMADLVGRRFGKSNKWPFASDKSMAGSFAFFVASTICAVGLLSWLQACGSIEMAVPIGTIAGIMAACTAVELVPVADDNWSVPLSAAFLSFLFLQ